MRRSPFYTTTPVVPPTALNGASRYAFLVVLLIVLLGLLVAWFFLNSPSNPMVDDVPVITPVVPEPPPNAVEPDVPDVIEDAIEPEPTPPAEAVEESPVKLEKPILSETDAFQQAVEEAIQTGETLKLGGPGRVYTLNRISIDGPVDGLHIDGQGATILAQTEAVLSIGRAGKGDVKNLIIENVEFKQADEDTANRGNYLVAENMVDSVLRGNTFHRVGNGGITLLSRNRNVSIVGNRFVGQDASKARRAIWVSGALAKPFHSQLFDTTRLTRNDLPLNSGADAPGDILISNNVMEKQGYGVYLINARRVALRDNYIEAEKRCIAVNNYSPGVLIQGGKCVMNEGGTGVLVTQFSHDVVIENMEFAGDYRGGRAIYVSHGAKAKIEGNRFIGEGTRDIQVDMAGEAWVCNNNFEKPALTRGRHIDVTPIDEAARCSESQPQCRFKDYGKYATSVPGVTIVGNTFANREIVLLLKQNTLAHGNVARMEQTVLANNVFKGRDQFRGGGSRVINVTNVLDDATKKPVQPIHYTYAGNRVVAPLSNTIDGIVHDRHRRFNEPTIEQSSEPWPVTCDDAGDGFGQ